MKNFTLSVLSLAFGFSLFFFCSALQAQSWEAIGPEGGRFTACMYDATDPDIIYVGADFGGLFKSTNGGQSWASMPAPDAIYFKHFTQSGSRIYLCCNLGLFSSDDGGMNWDEIPTGLSSTMLDALIVDPSDPDTLYGLSNVYCAEGAGAVVIKSTNAGADWTEHCVGDTTAGVDAFAVDPDSPNLLYAGTGCCGGGLFKSTDSGVNWDEAGSGLPPSLIRDIFIDSSDPTTVWAGTSQGLYKSEDSAGSWLKSDIPAPTVDYTIENMTLSAGALYAGLSYFLDGDENHYNKIYKTTNGGTDWMDSSTGLGAALSGRIESLCVAPSDSARLLIGTYGEGVYISEDGATSWEASNAGLLTMEVASLTSSDAGLFVGASVGGAFRSLDGGQSWLKMPLGHRVDVLISDGASPEALYAVSDSELFKSTDDGENWSSISPGHNVHEVAVAPSQPLRVYAGGCGQPIARSDDGGQNWAMTAWVGDEICVIGMAVDPEDPDVLFATAAGGWPNGGLYKTIDGGGSFEPVPTSVSNNALRSGLIFHPTDGQTAYLAVNPSGLIKTEDGGGSWAAVDSITYTVSALTFDPQSHALYAAFSNSSAQRVAVSEDDGENWNDLSADLPDFTLRAMTSSPDGSLFVGSKGAGVFLFHTEQEADGGVADGGEDAGMEDAGTDDAGTDDAGIEDAGIEDAGTDDAGIEDAGTEDAGEEDAGTDDAGLDDAGTEDAGEEEQHTIVGEGCGCTATSGSGPIWLGMFLLLLALRRRKK
ncbi:MAG: hypothetical protein JRF33_12475 [Deltaproteobacteria bacterium]|nr:hypothetical protein [Deltaproteobacteria bacterium]